MDDLTHLTKNMSERQKFEFYNNFYLYKKETIVGIFLSLALGWCGMHRFWLNDKKGGIIYLIFFWTFLPFVFSIVDAICMNKSCKKFNNNLALQSFKKLTELSPPV
jgi:TM2 domain-containing membrane protein YozV